MRKLLVAALLFLSACSDATVLTPVSFHALPDWQQDHQAEAFQLFIDSCAKNRTRANAWMDKDGDAIGDRDAWLAACDAADELQSPTDEQARAFFEQHFDPVRVSTEREPRGLITGYYEPLLHGAMKRGGPYQTPVYGLPKGERHFTREEIENGALVGKAPVLLYVDDPVMLFFLHIQGSGKVRLGDGKLVGLQYAGQNGYDYIAIGHYMHDCGMLDLVSMQTIRDWLRAHPDQAQAVMNQNPSYVYFKLAAGDAYAKGALGLPLTPERSIAIDDDRAAYGVPTYISTRRATHEGWLGQPFRRLFVSQDTGGALHGPHRADVFFGRGEEEEWAAGHQNERGKVYWLLPKNPKVPPIDLSQFTEPDNAPEPDVAAPAMATQPAPLPWAAAAPTEAASAIPQVQPAPLPWAAAAPTPMPMQGMKCCAAN